ncbi:MAG: type IV pilus assembly protein PilW [Cocleimonas sp.]|jgi:type IV pilus assembly protein PilW
MNKHRKFPQKTSVLSKHQSGLSLFELLIAMIIGLFLLLGITTSYLSSKKSSITRDQVSVLEDNGRVALEVLANAIQHTGYRSTSLIAVENPFMTNGRPTNYSCGPGFNSVLDATDFPNAIVTNNGLTGDGIGVVYLGDDSLNTDCTGNILPEECRVGAGVDSRAHRIYNAFFVNADDNLQCVGSQANDEVTIAEGVENIQVLYGINVDDDTDKSVERYVNATDVGADWGRVVSVQIGILVRSSIEVKDESESQSFTVLDTQVDTLNDRYKRAVFSTSIKLRNL